MDSISRDTIKIDRDEKEVIITNNTPLYKSIKSGAAVSLFPIQEMMESIQSAAECVDPALSWFIGILTRVLEATYRCHVLEWTVTGVRSLQLSAEGLGIGGGSITMATD